MKREIEQVERHNTIWRLLNKRSGSEDDRRVENSVDRVLFNRFINGDPTRGFKIIGPMSVVTRHSLADEPCPRQEGNRRFQRIKGAELGKAQRRLSIVS